MSGGQAANPAKATIREPDEAYAAHVDPWAHFDTDYSLALLIRQYHRHVPLQERRNTPRNGIVT